MNTLKSLLLVISALFLLLVSAGSLEMGLSYIVTLVSLVGALVCLYLFNQSLPTQESNQAFTTF